MGIRGKRIKRLRSRRNMLQADLAKTVGISQSALSQIEQEKVQTSVRTLTKLADVLQCRESDLIYPTQPKRKRGKK